jgi:K+/H+ antiporter YhaU regulatory subunit KhtT
LTFYSLIVPESCRLASDGGLDYQRSNLLKGTEKQKHDEFLIEDGDKDENCVTKEQTEENKETDARILLSSSIEKRISAMEEKLDVLFVCTIRKG